MGSKRKGACNLPSTSEADEGSDRRKSPVLKTFRIYSSEYVTSSNRDEKRSVTIALNVNTTEREIRDILIRKLPQLGGKRFKFFTKDGAGKWYFCPCSLKCEGKDHSAEWNGRNIPRAAQSNRTVYILIESTTMEQTRSRGVQNDTSTTPVPTGAQFFGLVGQYSSNPRSQKQVKVVVKSHQSVQSYHDLSLNGLEYQENTSVPPLSATYGNDLNQWPTYHLSQEQTIPETEYGKVKDGGRVTEEKHGEGKGRIDMGDEEMWNNDVVSTSGYDTSSLESSTYVPSEDLPLPMPDEDLQPYLDSVLPSPTPTILMEIVNGESARNLLAIEEIVPIKGDIKGGDRFVLRFAEHRMVDHRKVRFGIADPVPVIRRGNDYWGNNPPYPTPGEVQVQLVTLLGDPISDTATFTYTDESATKKSEIKPKDIWDMDADDLPLVLLEIAHRMGQRSLQLKENTNQPDDANTEAMLLLRIIVDTGAKINAIDFFRIVFSTNVGRSVFKCFKDEQPLLEEIARENGHDELASLLEEKHLMYQDDENDSDDEVDWKELVKAIGQYQTFKGETNKKKSTWSAISSESMYVNGGDGESSALSSSDISVAEGNLKDTLEDQDQAPLETKCPEEPNTRCARCERLGETAEKKSIPSTSSSEQTEGYLGDGESSTSLSSLPSLLSLHLSDAEGFTQNTVEDQQTTQESVCGEEPNTCQSTAAEGCLESTLEEQQTTPESTCEEEPDTCQTIGRIARGLIQDEMSDTDVINTISSSDQLRMNNARHIKESQSSIGEKNLPANLYLNPLHLAGSGLIIMKSFQMDKFAPKEVSSLRRKLGPFDTAKMNTSALYPDRHQTIYNVMERLDTPSELHFLEELKQDLTGGLKAQKGIKHQETADKELCDAKRKGAAVIKTESITCLYSPLQSKVESGVEIAALAGSASNSSLEEQSTEEEISQDARFFDERSASNISLEEQSTEEEITQDARFFDERKSACLWFLKTRRLAYAVLLTSLLIVVVCLVTIFTSRASTKKQTPSTWVETMTTSRQACSNGLLTLSCEGVTKVNAVHKVRWKIKFPEAGWKEFSYCGRSGTNCVVTRPELPEGIKVLKVSNRSVNLQRVAKNNTNGYAQTMCQVLYSDNSRTSHVHKINFTAKCVRIHEHSDLNLTKILQSLVRCERAVDIEWYSIDGNKFAYCNTCQDCKKLSEVNREHVVWNRLQVTRDSLLLTAIQESDDGRTIKVKVHMEASGKSAGRDVEESIESAHMYTIWIFVNTSRPPVVNCSVLSVGHLVKTSPHSCVTSQMKFNTTCSFSCPHGYQLQGPSYKQCGANGQWTDNAKSVSCQDVNECTASNGGCSHKCVNTGGDYKCECPDPELSLASDNKTCHVVNCSVLSVGHLVKTSPDSCVTSQMKFNTTCSFSCPHGYQLQGPSYKQCGANGRWTDSTKSVSCQDVNECTASNGGCSHKCVNTAGYYKCECPDRELSLASDNKTCHVVNCSVLNVGHLVKTSPDSCVTSQMKFNTTCSFSCPHGYQLQGPSYKQCGSNGQWTDSAKSVSCQDVNECTAANGGCSHKCVNTAGGYKCECPDPELSLASDNKTCHGVCPNSWIYLQGSCYKLFSEAESWNAANFACEALGAKLVVLNSLAENQAVGEKVTGGKGTYIGLYRSPKDKSRWLWLDQSRATFTHWYSGEPNNVWESENCVQMLSKSMRYEWNDLSCNNVYEIPYVCKTSVVNCSVLSVGHLVKTSPDSCVTSQMKFSTTCSFSCPHGYQLQGPSYKQCRTNGQWTDSAKSVSCQDVNECTASNGGCSHKCVNTAGGYKCECPDPELSLAPDNKTCHVPEKENKSLFGSPVKMAAVDDCQEMQYWNGTSCIPCSGCPRGFGLKTKCQSKRDTECVACYPGYDYSNTTGFELCIPCDRYSNCLPGRSKKIKECTIFSGPVCDGCEDGNYFNPTLGGCVKCSFPCSILQEEIRSCTTDHDRKCKAKRTVTPPSDSPTSPATEVPSAGLDWRVDLEPPLVQNGGLWGGVAGGFVLLVIAIAVTIIKSKSRNRRKRHATAENDGQLRNPLMLNLDQSISNLTIKGRRFITRRLNGKCYDGCFYWEICAHKLGYQTECESWKYAENPAEKFLTAYGEKAGSTIKKLVDVLRDPEVDLTQIADEIERELFLLSYEVDNVEETEI